MDQDTRGWSAYERMVLSKLDEQDKRLDSIEEKLVLLRIDVAQLKIKAGVWGAAAGMMPALITALVVFIQGGSP